MYDEDWGESTVQVESSSQDYEDIGRSSGRGRGYACKEPDNNNHDWGYGKKDTDNGNSGYGGYQEENTSGGWEDRGNFNRDRPGNRGRGGGTRRGGRGGHGNDNFRRNEDDGGWKNFGDDDDDGFKPSGRRNFGDDDRSSKPSGRRNYGSNDDSDFQPSNRRNFENDDGDYKSSGRRDFGGNDDNGFRSSGRRNFGDDDGDFKSSGRRNYGNNEDDEGGNFRRGGGGRGRGGRGRGGDFGGGGRGGFGDDRDGCEDKPKPEIYIPPDEPTDEATIYGSGVSVGINFDKYDSIEVKVTGDDRPPAITSFEQAGLRNLVLENIQKSGYTKPTPVQKYALPIIMAGRDLMACAQTGSGKTAAFAIPIINSLLEYPSDLIVTSSYCEPQVVIVSPTRELTIQIWQQMHKFALHSILKTVVAYGGTSVIHQSRKLFSGCHILVATPGRLLDFVEKGKVRFSSVRFLVLDEADRMLDMGFLPSIEKIVDHETMVPQSDRQTLMFSATFPDEVQRLAARFLNNYLFLAVGIIGSACTDVEQQFHEVDRRKKLDMLKQLVQKEYDAGTLPGTLIFVEQKKKADFLAAILSEKQYPTTSIHGDRFQRQREEALADFKSGRMHILVATAVAARGLDIKNVSHVINFDMPKDIDEYVHRIGRTGRVGNRGRATSLFDSSDDAHLRGNLVRILQQAGQPVPDFLLCDGVRSFEPSAGNQFGGEDIRDFDSGVPYPEEAYTSSAGAEPDEQW